MDIHRDRDRRVFRLSIVDGKEAGSSFDSDIRQGVLIFQVILKHAFVQSLLDAEWAFEGRSAHHKLSSSGFFL